ncbi:TonB-dependent receptor [Algibacillus agarilyticus]|uniref:TonB-dependent receptor n=1 Tax=Algibacillus agarilyticus TaxID=2234133 RepID=UPI000DD0802F|nr:TonB-dependent receptor [Algibacillus agarilyticus]
MQFKFNKIALSVLSAATLTASAGAFAAEEEVEVIEVSGIRGALISALNEKRSSNNLVEVIDAVDIGKLPDQNLAEVLENITGIQITRSAGIGTGVQIRGSNSNRVLINGVATVSSGSGRSGISFEDVNASIIAGVDVTKAPDAKSIEGSVGGIVNLRTVRPLELTETLIAARIQGEDSSLSTEGIQPRFSGAFGDTWETNAGKFGFVVSGSYTEQEAVSFRPRTDRDNLVQASDVADNGVTVPAGTPDQWQGIQFLVQEQENDDYETTNLAATLEWAPNDNTKFHFDAIMNSQERSRDNYRVQASGVSSFRELNVPSQFETINYGTVGGVNIGSYQAALVGTIGLDTPTQENPNLRFSSETGSRVTDNNIFVLGGEWQGDNLKLSAELSTSKAETSNPTLSTTVNFMNPKCTIDGNTRNENCTPIAYDLRGGSLSWGIDSNSSWAPSAAELTNPANMVLDQVDFGNNTTENSDTAFRIDAEYFIDAIDFITTVDVGYRFSNTTSEFHDIDDRIGGFSSMADSPNGALFSELLIKGPSNYGDADGRSLFVSDFLLLDPDRSFQDPQGTINILQQAVDTHLANQNREKNSDGRHDLIPEDDIRAFRDIEEDTTSFYAQANFEYDIVRGHFGARYVKTDVTSTGYGPDDTLESATGSYNFVLPRLGVIVEPAEDLLIRLSYGKDINRPGFNRLGSGYSLTPDENSAVALGNPGLEPEEITSFDISAEWYFADAAVLSVGYFTKDRTNIFGTAFEGAKLYEDDRATGGLYRDASAPCQDGGFYNPTVVPGILGDPNLTDQLGMCVDITTQGNDNEKTTQSGFEFAFQYGLSEFENELGWASGFGVVANYTIQDYKGGSIVDSTSGRGEQVLGDVSIERGLLDFSENAYNFTLYYEKYDLSARVRYTWREAFRTQDFGGGANTSGSSTLSFPAVTADRGQLNASVNYDVTEQLNVGVEAVNLTEERIDQYCVAEDSLLCFVGLPDRRVTFGATYKF